MALFFHSHKCNKICKSLGLTPFDLSTKERRELNQSNSCPSQTVVRGHEVICESPTNDERSDFPEFFRQRARSNSALAEQIAAARKRAGRVRTYSDYHSMEDSPPVSAVIITNNKSQSFKTSGIRIT